MTASPASPTTTRTACLIEKHVTVPEAAAAAAAADTASVVVVAVSVVDVVVSVIVGIFEEVNVSGLFHVHEVGEYYCYYDIPSVYWSPSSAP